MKIKRTLFIFIALIFAVCVSCAFLAGCADNETNKDDVSNVDDNVSDTDFDYTLVTGDEIFNEGVTLEEIYDYLYNFTKSSTVEYTAEFSSNNYHEIDKIKYQSNNVEYFNYGYSEKYSDDILYKDVFEEIAFIQNDCIYQYNYNFAVEQTQEKYIKELTKNFLQYDINKADIAAEIAIGYLLEENGKIVVAIEDILGDDKQKYNVSSYIYLKGNLLEFGYLLEGKAGSEYEGYKEQFDYKAYGINSTEIEIPDVDLSTATWSDTVEYNGITYRKDTDSDGNEYYYVDYYNSSSSAEPETTINTLPVKPREN